MKYFLAFILIIASFLLAAQPKDTPEKWVTVLMNEQQGIAHDVDIASIKPQSETQFSFVHRIRLRSPVPGPDGKLFDSIVVLAIADCKSKLSKMMADVMLLADSPVAKNVLSDDDTASQPEPGSIHYIVMQRICKKAGSEV
jgi:hypothetical protein